MAQVNIRSREEILGDLARTISINTDIKKIPAGSDMATLLEAISESISQAEASSLKILEAQNIDSLTGTDLDKKAQSLRIPNGLGGYGRKPSSQASGPVVIGSSFTKISSKLYAGKPAPFAGSFTLFVENASSFPATGNVYVGRGTLNRFEGAIPYASVQNNGSFWTITLSQPLTKDHLLSDVVTLSQGGDRTIQAGTVVQVKSNNDSPAINFTTTKNTLIPDGEDSVEVNVICSRFGTSGNALAGSITAFTSQPFQGATVTNNTSFRNGQSTESDEDLRQRIKNYPSTLSRGVDQAIKSALRGSIDPESGRAIQSVEILPPVEPGDYARVFIDDNTGLEPSFENQASEILLKSAQGQETRFQTAQRPITPAMVECVESGPYALTNTMSISFKVDEIIETYTVTVSNYKTLSSATAYEIVRDLNTQSNTIGFRTIYNGTRLAAIDLSGNAERIQVLPSEMQVILGFPTSELRPIFLYKNSELLSFRGKTATLDTRPLNEWNITAADLEDVRVVVDGVTQTFSVTDADFTKYSTTVSSASISQWKEVLSSKIAGVKFSSSGQILTWSAYNALSATGSLRILEEKADGSPAGWVGDNKMWLSASSGGTLYDVGAPKDYNFNRFSGEITLLNKPNEGDTIEVATRDTRAAIKSIETDNGLYALTPLPATVGNSRLIVGFDGTFAVRDLDIGSNINFEVTQPDAVNATNIIRMSTNSTGVFASSLVGDFMYIIPDQSVLNTILPDDAEGFYRILSRGYSSVASDVVSSGLSGQSNIYAGLIINTKKDSNVLTVSFSNHGLKTGDVVTISHVGSIGGISGANLSVSSAPIIKIDEDKFLVNALANATSDSAGAIDSLGTNKILVTHLNHGMQDGSFVDTVVTTGFGGISAGNLSLTDTPIEYVSANSYYIRVVTAATSTEAGIITTLTKTADCWIEFEVSSVQLSTWTAMISNTYGLSSEMVRVFKCDDVTPQLIDFGDSVSSLSVDSIVSFINGDIASGKAEKINPRQLKVRSSKFDESGTCAVLASFGNAQNIFIEGVDGAIQSHVGYSASSHIRAGAPRVTGIELPTDSVSGYSSRTYLKVDKNITDVLTEADNPVIESPTVYNPVYPNGFQHLWFSGRSEGYSARVYNNQTTAPYTGIMINNDSIKPLNTFDSTQGVDLNRYANIGLRLNDLPLNNYDSLVVEMDSSPTDKTVSVPAAKSATILDIDAISGSGKGQVISFRLSDPDDLNKAFFDSSSVYKDFDFTDFKMLTKSVGLYREDVSDRAMILRSVDYGAMSKLRLSVRLPSNPDQSNFLITHSSGFHGDIPRTNIIVTLTSDSVIPSSTLGSGPYKMTATAVSTLYNWRVSSANLNTNSSYTAGNLLNIFGSSVLAGSYEILSAVNYSATNLTATSVSGSNVININKIAHGLQTGDLISVSTTTAMGGITAIQLSVASASVTVLDANNYTYSVSANATSNDSQLIDSISGGVVVVEAPSHGGLLTPVTFDAASAPLRTFALLDKNYEELAEAINNYLPDNPIATAETIGTDVDTTFIAKPTYSIYPNAVAYSGSDISGSYDWHSFECKYSGEAGIFQYDSSDELLNNIKATVQSDDPIFPTASEATGTDYSPVGETVQIVPTNNKTLSAWMNFKAITSLGLLSSVERVGGDTAIQVSSLEDGSAGGVKISGVTANSLSSAVIGNASSVGDSIKVSTFSANARSMVPNQYVKLENSLSSEILRTYRDSPEGTSVTQSNTETISTYFRPENSIKYIRVNQGTGRLIFLRNGMAPSQDEPLDIGNDIQLTDLGNGLVQVTGSVGASAEPLSGKLTARVGDMMYIQPNSPFALNARCKALPVTGATNSSAMEYLGYPVVHVIDDNNIIVIAPNITTFGTTALTSKTDLVFIPAVWNEKNIRTNKKEGAKFDEIYNNGNAGYMIKSLGNGLVSLFFQNSSSEVTDDMKLQTMSVSTDDLIELGNGFDLSNQGRFRIIAHNGRNHVLFYNENGGKDEIIDEYATENGGEGSRKWGVSLPEDNTSRPVRIIASESVKIGDKLRISSPSASSQWFNDVFFGSWSISGIGYQALDYGLYALPHELVDGDYDQAFFAPYVDFEIANAPIGITDSNNDYVDSFLIGDNDSSIGFTEGSPFSCIRMVSGSAVNAQNVDNRDLFLRPQIGLSKFSSTFGTNITALNKVGFEERSFSGIDGYKVYNGLVSLAHNIIDGLPSNSVVYPGVKAAGAVIEVQTPLIKSVQVSLQVRPTDGVTLNSITELVKSAVSSYVNGLGVGMPVVVSEVIRTVQSLPGVFSVSVVSTIPVANDNRIVVGSYEKAWIYDISTDITVG